MSDILRHVDNGVMTLTFNRVDKKNSITSAMYATLADALAQAVDDAQVRVVVFQGHETIFSAGNDIGDFLNQPPSGKESPVYRFLRNIASFPKPILAAVTGSVAKAKAEHDAKKSRKVTKEEAAPAPAPAPKPAPAPVVVTKVVISVRFLFAEVPFDVKQYRSQAEKAHISRLLEVVRKSPYVSAVPENEIVVTDQTMKAADNKTEIRMTPKATLTLVIQKDKAL